MPLSAPARSHLLQIARQSVRAAVLSQPHPSFDVAQPELQAAGQGAFVTLKNQGRLRGCLGRFTSDLPLWRTVAEMARASAVEDFRFVANPITADELPHLAIDISILSTMEPIDNPLDIQLGVHGIYIKGPGGRSGTYLPQVAVEHNMSKEEFLSSCCANKAHLDPDAWRTGEAKVYTYTAEVIEEQRAPH